MARSIRNYLIYPKFQILILCANLLFVLVSLAILYAAMSTHFNNCIELGDLIQPEESARYFEFISMQRKSFDLYFLVTGISIFTAALVGNLILTHKIVGPMYHLRVFFNEFKRGDRVNFRKGDFFSELPDAINCKIIELEGHNDVIKRF